MAAQTGTVLGGDRLDEREVHRHMMKNSRGVHARWAELIGSYYFSITHAKVIVEDCVFWCPSHLPEPTQAELDMDKD